MKKHAVMMIFALSTMVVGVIWAIFFAEIIMNNLPFPEMFLAGLITYLLVVVVFYFQLLLKKVENCKKN